MTANEFFKCQILFQFEEITIMLKFRSPLKSIKIFIEKQINFGYLVTLKQSELYRTIKVLLNGKIIILI